MTIALSELITDLETDTFLRKALGGLKLYAEKYCSLPSEVRISLSLSLSLSLPPSLPPSIIVTHGIMDWKRYRKHNSSRKSTS